MLGELTKYINDLDKSKTPEVGWFDGVESLIYGFLEFGGFNGRGNENFVPARPHRLKTVENNKNKWVKFVSKSINNGVDIGDVMSELSDIIHKDYLDILNSGDFESLAIATIKSRRYRGISGDTPLVATGHMQNSLSKKLTGDN